jgi:hypothetical protein
MSSSDSHRPELSTDTLSLAQPEGKSTSDWTEISTPHAPQHPIDAGAGTDPRLWTATTYCMPVERRVHLLGFTDQTTQ